MGNTIIIDTESDGFIFESTKLWTIRAKNRDTGEWLKVNPFKDRDAKSKFVNFIHSTKNPVIVGHNQLGFDIIILMKFLGITFTVGPDTIEGLPVQFIDTYYLSMFLNPDREGHGLEWWGTQLGYHKIDWRAEATDLGLIQRNAPKGAEFQQHHERMDNYCDRDVEVGEKVLAALESEWFNVYRKPFEITQAFKCGQKSFFLMTCQELSGFKFDVEAAQELKARIEGMMEEIRADVEPKLPPRGLKKSEVTQYTMPAKPFKADGSVSVAWIKFVEKHDGFFNRETGLWSFYGEEYEIIPGQLLKYRPPMEMANQDQMKEFFIEQGWKPTFYNYQRGPDGKPMRDPKTRKLIETSPKIQEQGKICPNLLRMEGDIVKQVVKWLSLRNRLSVLEGWLSNERLKYDGRLGAGRSGIAATHRQKHKTVVNVPKASEKVLLGKEFRSLWISDRGMLLAAGDAAALEGRVQGHYTHRYDDGKTADEILNGDPHSKNVMAFYDHIPEVRGFDINSPEFNKDDPVFKPYRDRSKNGFYAILYGAGGPKVASTLGLPEKLGNAKLERFWEANPATKQLRDNLERYWETAGRSKYLPSIDGRMLCTRKKSALLNTIFQSCGGITMDYACCFLDMWLGKMYWDEKYRPYYLYKGCVVRRVAYMHDEVEFECEEPVAEEVSRMIEKAIQKAGEFLQLKVPLAGEGKVGKNWKEVH